jgi:hypothetical protein
VSIQHSPLGNPCSKCGKAAWSHRPDHKPQGDPCAKCQMPAILHAPRKRTRHRDRVHPPEHKPVGDPCEKCGLAAAYHRERRKRFKFGSLYIGLDGEGQGRVNHKYVFLGAATYDGKRRWAVKNYHDGLSTKQVLDFILSLPDHARIFSYSFNYDLTKILQDIDNERLYLLARPELRQRIGEAAIKGPRAIKWEGYRINLQGTKFTVSRKGRHRVIWDVWKFYQSKFVNALRDWKVGSDEMLTRMTHMKDKRADFDKESPEAVEEYCYEECQYMAELAFKLVQAHEAAGLKLTNFYGAGSSASAMLKKMGIREKIKPAPEEMKIAVASSFFGGRFENSIIGKEERELYSYDISSAYPYQLCFLPCLLHGTWEHTKDRNKLGYLTRDGKRWSGCPVALVRYSLEPNHMISDWGPFPFRMDTGSICYPSVSGGGWVWQDEYLQGERLFPNVRFHEAYVYHQDCQCEPFQVIPDYYCERCRIGKEGPGIVIKLGCNSCYGKLAQSLGKGLYQSWIWAALITSGCRAQFLEVLGLHNDRANCLMVATDGIITRERFDAFKPAPGGLPSNGIPMPRPHNTGTDHTGKPLGGWEEDLLPQGIFFARPGVYFPLNPTDKQLKKIRGRGVGKGVVLENWKTIIESWEQHGMAKAVQVANVSRFCGFKSSISRAGKAPNYKYNRANGQHIHKAMAVELGLPNPDSYPDDPEPSYGQWITRKVELTFNPKPKRDGVNPDGKTLTLRQMPHDLVSQPYKKAIQSDEVREYKYLNQELLEQPDIDYADYELDSNT